jgi:hypothetical protein
VEAFENFQSTTGAVVSTPENSINSQPLSVAVPPIVATKALVLVADAHHRDTLPVEL